MPGSVERPSARHRRKTSRRRTLAGVAAFAMLGTLLMAFGPVGNAAAFGPNPVSGFLTADGFAVLSYQSIFEPVSINPGDLVFSDSIYVQFVDFGPDRSVHLTTEQNLSGTTTWGNATFFATRGNVTTFDFSLPTTTVEASTVFCVDGGCERFSHQSPLTLIPSGVLNIGGLDLLIFSISVEFLIIFVGLTLAAKWLTSKAMGYSPQSTIGTLLVLPHLAFGFVLALLFDYQLVDTIFSGSEFVIFPPVVGAFYFFWVLHLFNDADPALVSRYDPQGGHRLRENLWSIWISERPDGSKVLIGPRWGDWLARLFGHAPTLVPANVDGTKSGGPAEVPIRFFDSAGKRIPDATFRVRPGRTSPLDDFRIAGTQRLKWKGLPKPRFHYYVESDNWLDETMPHLSFHRTEKVPAKVSREGAVLTPPTERSVLTGPHYEDVPAAKMRLAPGHYVDVIVAAMGFIKAQAAYRRIGDLESRVVALESTKYSAAIDLAEEQIAEGYRLLDREMRPMTDAEAEDDVRSGVAKSQSGAGAAPTEVSESARPSGGVGAKGVKR